MQNKFQVGPMFWFSVCIIFVIGVIFFAVYRADTQAARRDALLSPREVAMLCTTDMATRFHIHPTLSIIIDGAKVTIPAEIGITDTCMHSIHTHDDTGTLHVEAPIQKDFTLADFFAVWDKPFDATHILDKTTDTTHVITMTVNGVPSTSFENRILYDKDAIVIEYKKK